MFARGRHTALNNVERWILATTLQNYSQMYFSRRKIRGDEARAVGSPGGSEVENWVFQTPPAESRLQEDPRNPPRPCSSAASGISRLTLPQVGTFIFPGESNTFHRIGIRPAPAI
jgi:hypothetical protein